MRDGVTCVRRLTGRWIQTVTRIASLPALLSFLVLAVPVQASRPRPAGHTSEGATQTNKDISQLTPGNPLEREIAAGQEHHYEVVMQAGQFLKAVVDQRGVDVVVRVVTPRGDQVLEIDLNISLGPETVLLKAEVAGDHRLGLKAKDTTAKGEGV